MIGGFHQVRRARRLDLRAWILGAGLCAVGAGLCFGAIEPVAPQGGTHATPAAMATTTVSARARESARASSAVLLAASVHASTHAPHSGAATRRGNGDNSLRRPLQRAAFRHSAGARAGQPAGAAGGLLGWLLRGAIALLTLPGLAWMLSRPRRINRIETPGFEIISPSERRAFIPLEEKFQAMDFISKVKTRGSLRLSANLNKVTLSIRRSGYLMEDKNYRNALLVNRRRVRRTLLRDGDVLDLGDLTLLYRDNRNAKVIRYSALTPPEGKTVLKFARIRGPVRRGTPMLVPEQFPNRIFYITKNIVFVGRSESNDLIIKAHGVHFRHAKIERVGGRFKIQDLTNLGNTFVNNRRVDQRFLKDGDEVSFESHRFRFQLATKTTRDRPMAAEQASEETELPAAETGSGDGDAADLNEEQE